MAGLGLQAIPLLRSIPENWDKKWFADFIRQVLAQADVRNALEGPGITIEGQPGEVATISVDGDIQNLLLQPYVTAFASAFLPNERVIDGENGVIEVTDNGPGSTITVGIFAGGIPYSKLNQLDELSVIGNPTEAYGLPMPIGASLEGDVLCVQDVGGGALGLVFTATPTWPDEHTFEVTPIVPNESWAYAKIQETAAASILLGRGDGGAGALEEITLGANLTMSGTTMSATGGGGAYATSTSIDVVDDLDNPGAWINLLSSGLVDWTSIANRPGVVSISVNGTGQSAYAFRASGTTSAFMHSWTPDVSNAITFTAYWRIPTLPTSTQQFVPRFGFWDNGGGSQNRVIAIAQWDTVSSSVRWQLITTSGGTGTTVTATTGPTANTWQKVDLVITTGTVAMLVDGVTVATTSTNIPTTQMGVHLGNASGSTISAIRVIEIDYIQITQSFPARF